MTGHLLLALVALLVLAERLVDRFYKYMTRRPVVLIEGNIGVGKTSLTRNFAKNIPRYHIVEEHIGTKFLAEFYKSPAKYGFALQMTQCAMRVTTLHAALRMNSVVLDRSILGDYAFALWNAACGHLTPNEWGLYQELAGPSVAHALRPYDPAQLIIVFLNDDAVACFVRAQNRNSPSDGDMTLAYLRGLEAAHLIVMACVPETYTLVEHKWTLDRMASETYVSGDFLYDSATAQERRASLASQAVASIDKLDNPTAARFLREFFAEHRR
jgi:deoxyadenosine/deoxycytidine kinase